MSGWRALVRIAWRDAMRSKGRSMLVLTLIALPVLAVTAADVAISTSQVSSVERLDRQMGTADAWVSADLSGWVAQTFDPTTGGSASGGRERSAPATPAQLEKALGRDATLLPVVEGQSRIRTDKGVVAAGLRAVDWGSPLTEGITRLVDGRYPSDPSEVAVNQALRDRGAVVDDTVTLDDGTTLTVTGTVEDGSVRSWPYLTAAPGGPLAEQDTQVHTYLLGAGPVTWDDVKALNNVGATVESRQVISDPPPDSVLTGRYADLGFGGGPDDSTMMAIVALIVTMVLLEVVLLAGPAFAVGARRQSRTMALMAASGGTPKQSRRLVLASAVVLGGLAATVGVVLGVLVGIALLPLVQRRSGEWLGPLDIPWLHLLGVTVFGLVAAFLAAMVPAYLASRQDVVAVLAGRRGDRAPSRRTPILGVVVLGAGILLAAVGAWANGSSGALLIAGAAIVCVLGMLLLVPLVVALVARGSARLPLALRFAARDAHRHRTRTVPAVAAVAATVAGVVALGISTSSDEAENRETYTPSLASGAGVVQTHSMDESSVTALGAQLTRIRDRLASRRPDVAVQEIRGLSYYGTTGEPYIDFQSNLSEYVSSYGGDLLEGELPPEVGKVGEGEIRRAEAALADGKAVIFVSTPSDRTRIRLTATWADFDTGETLKTTEATWPAYFMQVSGRASARGVLPAEAFAELGVKPTVTTLYLPGPVDRATQQDIEEVAAAVDDNASVYVERGYQAPDETIIIQLVLAALGAVLMLGGTLTATFLALSDARPDLATLSAVGAAPRTRRLVAAAYALVVGFVGALLGAMVGAVPGLAIARVLTITGNVVAEGSGGGSQLDAGPVGPFFDIPWLMIGGLVFGLPLLTALIVGLLSRSRLPLVARLD